MKLKDFDTFKDNCINGICNRNTMYNEKTCLRDYKQESCYQKYNKKINKTIEKQQLKNLEWENKKQQFLDGEIDSLYDIKYDAKDIELKKIIFKRDIDSEYIGNSYFKDWIKYCVIFNKVFTKDEKRMFLKNHTDISNSSICYLDIIHIESRSRKPELKYEPTNVVLGGRYIHSMLDGYCDLITGETMNEDRRNYWLGRIKNYIKEVYL